MIACHCRNLKESDFASFVELKQRIFKDDAKCKKCQKQYSFDGDDIDSTWQQVRIQTAR